MKKKKHASGSINHAAPKGKQTTRVGWGGMG